MHLIRLDDSAISATSESSEAGCHTVEASGHAARSDERPCGASLSAAERAFDRGCLPRASRRTTRAKRAAHPDLATELGAWGKARGKISAGTESVNRSWLSTRGATRGRPTGCAY